MTKITFSKYEGLGNDFIIIDESQPGNRILQPQTTLAFRKKICERKGPVGADGVITILPSPQKASAYMHVTNSDGSQPENCGNGLRCVARWLNDEGRVNEGEEFFIEAPSGLKKAKVDKDRVYVQLGTAHVDTSFSDPEVLRECERFSRSHQCDIPTVVGYVDLGNPHLVIHTPDFQVAQTQLGPRIEKLSCFKNDVNVGFFEFSSDPSKVSLRVWERGAGATKACGSGAGACVSALVCVNKLKSDNQIRVEFDEGELDILVTPLKDGGFDVTSSGAAWRISEGTWE